MRYILISIAILFVTVSHAQSLDDCQGLNLIEKEDYRKAEPCMIILADYALSQPMYGSDDAGLYAKKACMSWAEGTPDHTFSLNSKVVNIFEGNNVLLFNIYMACLVKAALTSEEKDLHRDALGYLVDYVKDTDNNVEETRAVKKLIKAWEDGKADKYIDD